MAEVLQPSEIGDLLAPYEISLPPDALSRLQTYLNLLLKWNRRLSLTAIRDPRRIVRELFGESLYLSRLVDLDGHLVDVGSGAGFPGLALKLVAPDLKVTLVESQKRKCAFLKEVARECRFSSLEVAPERYEDWVGRSEAADIITSRAVDTRPEFMDSLGKALKVQGKCCLFITTDVVDTATKGAAVLRFGHFTPLPGTRRRGILIGEKV